GVHTAGGGGHGRVAEPALGLHGAVSGGASDAARGGRGPQAPRGASRAGAGAAHLGPGPALASAPARGGDRRGTGLRRGWGGHGAGPGAGLPAGGLPAGAGLEPGGSGEGPGPAAAGGGGAEAAPGRWTRRA